MLQAVRTKLVVLVTLDWQHVVHDSAVLLRGHPKRSPSTAAHRRKKISCAKVGESYWLSRQCRGVGPSRNWSIARPETRHSEAGSRILKSSRKLCRCAGSARASTGACRMRSRFSMVSYAAMSVSSGVRAALSSEVSSRRWISSLGRVAGAGSASTALVTVTDCRSGDVDASVQ